MQTDKKKDEQKNTDTQKNTDKQINKQIDKHGQTSRELEKIGREKKNSH